MDTYTIHELPTPNTNQVEFKARYHVEADGGINREFLPDGDYIVRNNNTGEVIEYRIAGSGVVKPCDSTR